MHREPKITLNHEPKRNKTTMLDLQIQKAKCLCDLTDALPHYRKQLDRIDGRLTDYIADAISDKAAHANICELLGIRKVLRLMDGAPLVLNTN